MTMTTQCVFPAELICNILYHTDPRDIIRWRAVSKWFRTITEDAVLWKALYANVPFPRPPGPYPSQSIESLRRTLVKSAQLAQSWTTRPMRDVSSVEIHIKGDPGTPPKLVCGRWLVACELAKRFVLHDVNAGADSAHGRQVLWEQGVPMVEAWDVHSMVSVEGQRVIYVLAEWTRMNSDLWEWKLLEFRLNDQSGELYDSTVMHHSSRDPLDSVKLQCGKSPFLFIEVSRKCVVFDTRARIFYELPEFRIALDEILREVYVHDSPNGYQVAFTDTHLISFHEVHSRDSTIIQVFTLPSVGSTTENGNSVLRLTHECALHFHAEEVETLKSSVDPATGATNVMLLGYCTRSGDPEVIRIDLTLPKPSVADVVDVLPMTAEIKYIGFPEDEALESRYEYGFQHIDISDNGHARGFYMGMPRHDDSDPMASDHVSKFSVDTTQDQWVITFGESSPVTWIEECEHCTFDGMRGKLCAADVRKGKVVVVDIE